MINKLLDYLEPFLQRNEIMREQMHCLKTKIRIRDIKIELLQEKVRNQKKELARLYREKEE